MSNFKPKTKVHPKRRIPSYRLHKPSGQAVVSLSGRDIYLGPHGSPESRERYDAAVAEWLAGGRRAVSIEPESPAYSVNELALAYLDWCEGYYLGRDGKPATKELWHIRRALRPLRKSFGMSPVDAFGPKKLGVIREGFIDDGLCRGVINKYTNRIRHVFKWGVARELVLPEVWQALTSLEGLKRGRSAAREPQPVQPVSDSAIDSVKPYVSRQVWGLIELQRYSGCRPGEAVIVRGCDLDMSGPIWAYRPEHHKTEHHGKSRVIMLGSRAQEALRPFLKSDLEAFLFSPADADTERRAALTEARETPISCGNKRGTNRKRSPKKQPGNRYTPDSYRRAIHVGCAKAHPAPDGLSEDEAVAWRRDHQWHPNQIRHSFATKVRSQFGLDAAQVALGHSGADITQVYAEKDQRLAAAIAEEIG